MKTLSVFIFLFLFSPLVVNAQKDTISTSAKIDSIYTLQKKMYAEKKNTPLFNKTFGFEINPFRVLLIDKQATFSGTFSFFAVDRHAELAFPYYLQFPQTSTDLQEYTLDCHYRYFLGNTQNGFYLSAFARYAYLKGELGDNYIFFDDAPGSGIGHENKLGFGFGIGVRVFSYHRLYWGASFSFGRYLMGENNKFKSNFLAFDDDNEYILDFEFLKFGLSF